MTLGGRDPSEGPPLSRPGPTLARHAGAGSVVGVVEQDGQRLSIVVQARPGRRDRIKGCARGGCRWPCADYRADAGRGRYQTNRRPRTLQRTAECPARWSRLRGHRLAKAKGPDGWLSQPWLEPWHQEQHRWSEDYARKAPEWEERNWLVASMPPDVRAAYDAAEKASHDQLTRPWNCPQLSWKSYA